MDKRKNFMGRVLTKFLTSLLLTLVLYGPFPALAATAPTLGTVQSYGVLGGSTVTNTGPTVIVGDLGLSPGSAVTGFPPGTVIGAMHVADAAAVQAQVDATAAFTGMNQVCDITYPPGNKDLGGLTLTPGVYCSQSSFSLTGTLTLDGGGDPNAVWIFIMPASTLTTATDSVVKLINAAQDCNVFWRVGSSATLGTRTTFIGTIIAADDITLITGATISGRALARGVSANGAVTLDSNVITASVCAAPTPAPILGKGFSPSIINETNNVSTLTITLSNPSTSVMTLTSPLIDTLPTGVTIANTPNAITTCGGTAIVSAIAGGPNVALSSGSTIPAAIGTTPSTCYVRVDVKALNGSYLNTLPSNALQTNHGSNTLPAIATLTAVPSVPLNGQGGPPILSKDFSPVTINNGGVSTLTITLSNPNTSIATLSAPLIDILPTGVTIANPPNANNTCNGTVLAIAGGSNVTLLTGQIPNGTAGGTAGFCIVMVNVNAPLGGSFINTLPANASQTSNGNNTFPAIATLTVSQLFIPAVSTLPAFTPIGLAVLAGSLALLAVVTLRRRP